MTAAGLAVALPAVFAYNAFTRANRSCWPISTPSPTTCAPSSRSASPFVANSAQIHPMRALRRRRGRLIMAMGSFTSQAATMPTAEINMTPLVDDAGAADHLHHHCAVDDAFGQVDLPRAASTPTPEKPMTLQVSITGENLVYVGDDRRTATAWSRKFRDAVAQDANVEMHLKADRVTRYENGGRDDERRPPRRSDQDRLRHPARRRPAAGILP